ncbi:GSCOCG00004069001-RA-CDS [Cotesia congregata]|nr:GSCOCG00004069001-RA-CDS [Cotesia congregata]
MGNTLIRSQVVSSVKHLRTTFLYKLNNKVIKIYQNPSTLKNNRINNIYFELFKMPPKRGRTAVKEVEESNGQAEVEPRRGRTRAEKTKEEDPAEEKVEVQPKKRAAKKDAKKEEENGGEVEKKSKKGKKKNDEDSEADNENVDQGVKSGKQVEPAEEVEEKQSKTRGRKKKEEADEKEEKEVKSKKGKKDEKPKEDDKKKPPVKRGKKKAEDKEAEAVDEAKEDEDVEMKEEDPETKAVNGDDKKKSKAKPPKKTEDEPKKVEDEDTFKGRSTRTNKKKNETADEEEPAAKKAKTPANKTDTNLDEINFDCDKENAEGKKSNFKVCSWNVSGIRALLKKNGFEYIIKEDADIIALQETKCDLSKLPDDINIPGYKHKFLESTGQSGYSGIAVYSKEEFVSVTEGINDPDLDKEGRMLTIEYPNFYFVNVYVPNAGDKLKTMDKRMKWNTLFEERIKELDSKKPVIICGDLNVAHQEIDLKNPKANIKHAGFTPEERQGMTSLLEAGFVDVFRHFYPDKTDAYTFWSNLGKSREKNTGWRLDYYLVSDRIKDKVCDTVIRDKVYGSDHCPIVLFANLSS